MAQFELQHEMNGGRLITSRCLRYLRMSPEIPVGELDDQPWRINATLQFVRARTSDFYNENLDYINPLELNAVASAAIDHVYAKIQTAPPEEHSRLLGRTQGFVSKFFGATAVKAESDPELFNDDQLYKAACLGAAEGFIRPHTTEKRIPAISDKIRRITATQLLRVHRQITAKLEEYGDEERGPEMGPLFAVRAELLTSAGLMRQAYDNEPIEERAIVLPALARQSYSFARTPMQQRWSSNIWRLNTDAAQHSGVGIATPPDIKLRVRQAGSPQDAAKHDPSITYVSLINNVIHTQDERDIGRIVGSLRSEARRTRNSLERGARDELDSLTRNARNRVGW